MVDGVQPESRWNGSRSQCWTCPLHDGATASTERQPVLVLRQESDKTSASGARHLFLGLGYVENFDPATDLFRIRGLTFEEVAGVTGTSLSEESDELIETALRLESLEEWVPFAAEDRAVYKISRQKRDAAFRSIVLSNYDYTCCYGSAVQITSAR
jgi:hypothetical protein